MKKAFTISYLVFAVIFICFGIWHAIHKEWTEVLNDILLSSLEFYIYQLRSKLNNTILSVTN